MQVFATGWDHHADIYSALPRSVRQVDKACAALIHDLKERGLLDETLVIWGGEFGRTPMVQENNAGTGEKTAPGRDHHTRMLRRQDGPVNCMSSLCIILCLPQVGIQRGKDQ